MKLVVHSVESGDAWRPNRCNGVINGGHHAGHCFECGEYHRKVTCLKCRKKMRKRKRKGIQETMKSRKKLGIVWKGKMVKTYPDIIKLALKMTDSKERVEFVKLVLSLSPHMKSNIGYMAGYYDSETAQRIYTIFNTTHPVFGRTNPTPAEAFEAGWKLGETAKARGQGG